MNAPVHLIPTFLELAENLNISRTAEKLHLSQPAVSRQLQSLEENLGVTLFMRQSRGLILTSAGKSLKRQLEGPFETIRESMASLRSDSRTISGSIIFGCLTEIGQRLFVPLLLEFMQLHKEINLDIRLMSERMITQGIADGVLGLGLATQVPRGESFRAHHLLTERIVVVTSAGNKVDLEKNKDPQFVANSVQDPLLNSFLKKYEILGSQRAVPISVAVNSHQSMLSTVEKLGFYAVMPILSAEEYLACKRVRIASQKELQNKVYLVLPEREFVEKRYQEVVRFLLMKTRERRGS